MKAKYCCDAEKYQEYYASQSGSGIPGFVGTRYQRGAGLGSMLASLMKYVTPLLKEGASALGKVVLKKGLDYGGKLLSQKHIKRPASARSSRRRSKRARKVF